LGPPPPPPPPTVFFKLPAFTSLSLTFITPLHLDLCSDLRGHHRGRIQRKTWYVGPYAGVDYTYPQLTSTSESTPTHLHDYPMPESTLTLCQSRLYSPIKDFGFGLRCLGLSQVLLSSHTLGSIQASSLEYWPIVDDDSKYMYLST
jgi:hypothetical protein